MFSKDFLGGSNCSHIFGHTTTVYMLIFKNKSPAAQRSQIGSNADRSKKRRRRKFCDFRPKIGDFFKKFGEIYRGYPKISRILGYPL